MFRCGKERKGKERGEACLLDPGEHRYSGSWRFLDWKVLVLCIAALGASASYGLSRRAAPYLQAFNRSLFFLRYLLDYGTRRGHGLGMEIPDSALFFCYAF